MCTSLIVSPITLFFGLNYPNADDAKAGLNNNIISDAEYDKIAEAAQQKKQPLWDTQLGGWIGIHGKGEGRTDTQGCIALTDRDVKALDQYLKIGSKVTIYE